MGMTTGVRDSENTNVVRFHAVENGVRIFSDDTAPDFSASFWEPRGMGSDFEDEVVKGEKKIVALRGILGFLVRNPIEQFRFGLGPINDS